MDTGPYIELEKSIRTDRSKDHVLHHGKGPFPRLLIGLVIVQVIISIVCFWNYDAWYKITPLGSSAVLSSSLSGLSQGLLQLVIYSRYIPSNIGKFYVWGVINGIWTKIWTDQLSSKLHHALVRIVCDQLLGNPTSILIFLSFNSYWDGRDVDQSLDTHYFKALRTSYLIWPVCSFVSFYFLPQDYIVPFNCVVNLFWTLILGIMSS